MPPPLPKDAEGTIPESHVPVSQHDIDLVFLQGSTKLMLTSQQPLIRVIVSDSIETLRAVLLFRNAFPVANVVFSFTREALHLAAEGHRPGGTRVQNCLEDDAEYAAKLISLVSS